MQIVTGESIAEIPERTGKSYACEERLGYFERVTFPFQLSLSL